MRISTHIRGSGLAGKAAARAVEALRLAHPELNLEAPHFLGRTEAGLCSRDSELRRVLVIALPHAMHAQAILEGVQQGYDQIVVEKPSCVSLEEVRMLQNVPPGLAVCHCYRQCWGFRTLSKRIRAGELGKIVGIEGRYWQSSVAERAKQGKTRVSWKTEEKLSGGFDVLLDLGSHIVDMIFSLLGSNPIRFERRISTALAERAGQDTHVTLDLGYPDGAYAYASLSKIAHGSGNDLEIHVFGTEASGSWSISAPDELRISTGASTTLERRSEAGRATGLPPHHALGWNEGYAELFFDVFCQLQNLPFESFPTLGEDLRVVRALLDSKIK